MLLDTGDALIGGGPLGDTTKGEAIVAGMNLMGYDAMALGPNELSLGPDLLRQRMEEANFPMLSANVRDTTGQTFARPYVVLKIGEHRVGVIGLTRLPEMDVNGFEVLDPRQVVSEILPQVSEEAETVVVVTNLSYQAAQDLAMLVPGIDLTIAALPSYVPAQMVIVPNTGTLVVAAEMATPRHAGRRVGRLVVLVGQDGSLSSPEWQTDALGSQFADDPEMAALLNGYR